MPSSYTASLRFEKQFTGENVNTWGDRLNTALDRQDFSIAGMSTVALTGDYTLTSSNSSADEARSAILKFTGSPTLATTVTIPSVSKIYRVWNASSKGVTLTTGSGSTVVIDADDIVDVFCDGTNVKPLGYAGLSLKSYIAASVLAATGSLPSVTGNAGKYVYTDGSSSYWKQPALTEASDFASNRTTERAFAIAMALAL